MIPAQSPPLGYAHRGFSLDGAENSLAAFAAAVALGYRHLETDARASADGRAIAFHDPLLDRVTNHHGRVNRLSWQQISQARIVGREPIPLLEDVLGSFGGVHFNIDVKSDDAIGPTLDALGRTRSWQRVRLAAFSHRRLQALRRAAGPAVATALSPAEVLALLARRGRLPVTAGQPAAVAAQVPPGPAALPLVTARFVRLAHERGAQVHVWTVNTRPAMVRLLDLGVDALITDRADILREVLLERGAWPG